MMNDETAIIDPRGMTGLAAIPAQAEDFARATRQQYC